MTDSTAAAAYHFFQASMIPGECNLYGTEERWLAPISVFDAKEGFGESVWVNSADVSWLSIRLAGAPVACRWGKFRDRTSHGPSPTFQPTGAPNHFSADGPIRFAQLFLPDKLLNRVASQMSPGLKISEILRDDLIFLEDEQLERIYAEYLEAATTGASSLELEARSILIVARLLRVHHGLGIAKVQATGGLAPWQIKRACDAMESHLNNDISLDMLAKLAGLSAPHFCRAFKQSLGIPPFQWLLERRIERAKLLLADPTQSLSEIPLAVGFSGQSAFTTAFRRVTGLTPGMWRRRL